MRKLVLAIALCSIVSAQAVAYNTVNNETSIVAYEQDTKGDKYAILVQSIKNLRSSIMTGSEIKQAKYAPEQVHLVRSNYSSTLSRISFL
ncbi:hypothetical protein [Myroides odoratimimus]|uniref:hypothetical protein n=1 Tax=Myroides odoratimimus TaxID=76832 RepID=UPI0025781E9D|nr:hypothetical protein [Myroides odoratimimus]